MTIQDLKEIAVLLSDGRIAADDVELHALARRAVELKIELEIEQLEAEIAELEAEEALWGHVDQFEIELALLEVEELAARDTLDAHVEKFELELTLLQSEKALEDLGRLIEDLLAPATQRPTPEQHPAAPPAGRAFPNPDAKNIKNKKKAKKRVAKFSTDKRTPSTPLPVAAQPLQVQRQQPFKAWRPDQVEIAFTFGFPRSVPCWPLVWQLERKQGCDGFKTLWDSEPGYFTTSHRIAADANWVVHVHRNADGECLRAHIKHARSQSPLSLEVTPKKLVAIGIENPLKLRPAQIK